MALPERLVEKLACPICHRPLTYNRDENRLECPPCHLAYRIENDIPVLVPDEAEKLD
jgi:uncharacterized protein YbaR (Trm112 family)